MSDDEVTRVVIGNSKETCFIISHRDSFVKVLLRFGGKTLFDTVLCDEFFPISEFTEESLRTWGVDSFLPSFFSYWDISSDKAVLLFELGLVNIVESPIPVSEDNLDTFYYICAVKKFEDGDVYGLVGEENKPAMFVTQEEAFISKNRMEDELFFDEDGIPVLDEGQTHMTKFYVFSIPDKFLTNAERYVKPVLRKAGIDFTASIRNLREQEEQERKQRKKEMEDKDGE